MHVEDHKGVTCIVAGSILVKLVTTCARLGSTQQIRLDMLNKEMKEFQSIHKIEHRMPPLRLEDLRRSGWANLQGKVVKAANSRALLPFLEELSNTYFLGHGSYNSSTRKLLAALNSIEKLFASAGMFFTDEQKQTIGELFDKVGRHWQNLRYLSDLAGEQAYQITPKVHLFMHFPMSCDLINPLYTQSYGEESLIGRATKIWAASSAGMHHLTIQRTSLTRYWTGLELRVSDA